MEVLFRTEYLLGATTLLEKVPGFAQSFQENAGTQVATICAFCIHPNSWLTLMLLFDAL
jgi:hypothetical protein